MKRKVVVILAALLVAAAPAHAAPKQPTVFRYVATGAYSDLERPVSERRIPVAGHLSPLGNLSFVARGDSFVLRIDDLGVGKGKTLGAWIGHAGAGAWRCITDSVALRLPSRDGERVLVILTANLPGYGPACDASPSAGTARVLA